MKWPLWFGNSIADDRNRQPISGALKLELLGWTRFYHEHYDDEWDSDENATHCNEMGRAVAQRVSAELGSEYRVLVQLQRTESGPQKWIEVAPEP
jgi:hypothetical protein